MKPIKTFKIGSNYFFDGFYNDYVQKDHDEMQIMDRFIGKTNVLNLKNGKNDVFFWRNMDKEGFINDCLTSGVPMRAGKFLIKEFAEYIGMTIADLEKIRPMFDIIDDRHTYEKIICDAYIENGGFYLTEKQRMVAYENYKQKRPEIYNKGLKRLAGQFRQHQNNKKM